MQLKRATLARSRWQGNCVILPNSRPFSFPLFLFLFLFLVPSAHNHQTVTTTATETKSAMSKYGKSESSSKTTAQKPLRASSNPSSYQTLHLSLRPTSSSLFSPSPRLTTSPPSPTSSCRFYHPQSFPAKPCSFTLPPKPTVRVSLWIPLMSCLNVW